MKKFFALFLALLLCLSLLVACGDDEPEDPSYNPLPPSGNGGNGGGDGTLPPLGNGGDNFAPDIEWDGLLG